MHGNFRFRDLRFQIDFELSPARFNGRKNSELKVVITFAFTFVASALLTKF